MRNKLRLLGSHDALHCPVCNNRIHHFLPLPEFYLKKLEDSGFIYSLDDGETMNYQSYLCPCCDATDRDRLYALYISRYLREHDLHNISLLEIAPQISLSTYIKSTGRISLRTADLMRDWADNQVDITDMACYEDNSFDSFVCSHVLEHVPEDIKAIQELYRVLKPGGWGILMVPIILCIDEIDEDPSLEDKAARWRRFGEQDHVRMYSKKGFLERVEAVGFIIHQYGKGYFGLDAFKKHGVSEKSILYVVEKLAPSDHFALERSSHE